jgi:hypothetical protein
MQLDLNQIRLDGGTQPRAELLLEVIGDYAEQMRQGAEFPPVTVFFDGKDYWLADGFHRLMAAKEARPGQAIEVDLQQGTLSQAQWFSYSANKSHGLRRTNDDKRRAVKAALTHPQSRSLSDAAIADHVGVHRNTVISVRRELGPPASDLHKLCKSEARTGRDGRTINTANIGRKPRTNIRPGKARTSLTIHRPVRAPSPAEPMTTVTLPQNAVMGAMTLIDFLPREYLQVLVDEISAYLNKKEEQKAVGT